MNFNYKDENRAVTEDKRILGFRKARSSRFILQVSFFVFIVYLAILVYLIRNHDLYIDEEHPAIWIGLIWLCFMAYHLIRHKYLIAVYGEEKKFIK